MESSQNPQVSTKEKNQLSFIHRTLDCAEIDVYEFRVYGHINRVAGDRGTCFQRVNRIAKECRICLPYVQSALKKLVAWNMLGFKSNVNGRTNHYWLTHPSEWTVPMRREQSDERATNDISARASSHLCGSQVIRLDTKLPPSKLPPRKEDRPRQAHKDWQLNQDKITAEINLENEKKRQNPDADLLEYHRQILREIRAEQRYRGQERSLDRIHT